MDLFGACLDIFVDVLKQPGPRAANQSDAVIASAQ